MVVANVGNGKMTLEVSGTIEEITKDFCVMLDNTKKALGKRDEDIAKIFEIACVGVLLGIEAETINELFDKHNDEKDKK